MLINQTGLKQTGMVNTSVRGDGHVFYYFSTKNRRFAFNKEEINYNVHFKCNRYHIYYFTYQHRYVLIPFVLLFGVYQIMKEATEKQQYQSSIIINGCLICYGLIDKFHVLWSILYIIYSV